MLPGRTTPSQVGEVIQVTPGDDVTPFIDSANELVTEKCAVVFPGTMEELDNQGYPTYVPVKGGYAYSPYRLELIERWLSAHFYAVFSQQSSSEKAGDVAATYQGKTEFGLKSTVWGQQAMRLDTQGGLAVYDNGQNQFAKVPPSIFAGTPVGVTWLGRRRGPWGRHPNCGGF